MSTSSVHDGLVQLFRDRPELAPKLLRELLQVAVPAYSEARVESADFSEPFAVEFRADLVVLLVDDRPVLVIVLEVQLGRDDDKRYSWVAYLALARARFRCPAVVLVVAPDEAVARWAHRPIAVGPGCQVRAVVLGPEAVPVVDDREAASAAPELAVLSAVAHGNEPESGPRIALAAMEAASTLPDDLATLYFDIIRASLGEAARSALEKTMSHGNYEYQSDFAKKYVAQGRAEGRAEGEAKGEAKTLLRILAARGLDVTDEQRERILGCTDLAVLDRWVDRAVTANSTADILAD